MEVYLSKNLRHRNIVKMLDYATRVRKVSQALPYHFDPVRMQMVQNNINCKQIQMNRFGHGMR